MNKYTTLEKGILETLADLSLQYGPVEVQITTETTDGDFVPEFIIKSAPDGVIRGLMEDDGIASLDLEYGELHVLPAPRRLQGAMKEASAPPAAGKSLDDYTDRELLDELQWRATSKK